MIPRQIRITAQRGKSIPGSESPPITGTLTFAAPPRISLILVVGFPFGPTVGFAEDGACAQAGGLAPPPERYNKLNLVSKLQLFLSVSLNFRTLKFSII